MAKIQMEFDLEPFNVPDYVTEKRNFGDLQFGEDRKFTLAELPPEALEQLCEEFTTSVFRKAKKVRPIKVGAAPITNEGFIERIGG